MLGGGDDFAGGDGGGGLFVEPWKGLTSIRTFGLRGTVTLLPQSGHSNSWPQWEVSAVSSVLQFGQVNLRSIEVVMIWPSSSVAVALKLYTAPQWGHELAIVETFPPHSLHSTKAILPIFECFVEDKEQHGNGAENQADCNF